MTGTEKDIWATEDRGVDAEGGGKTVVYSVFITAALVYSTTPDGIYVGNWSVTRGGASTPELSKTANEDVVTAGWMMDELLVIGTSI